MKQYIQRIINLRTDRDRTQKEIGIILNKTQQGYDHIEKERAKLTVEDLKELCLFYNVSADYILGLPKNMPYPER